MWLVCPACGGRNLVAKSWGADWVLWDAVNVAPNTTKRLQDFVSEHFWCAHSTSQLAQGSHLRIEYDHEDDPHTTTTGDCQP
jgi:hypothetical protein